MELALSMVYLVSGELMLVGHELDHEWLKW